MIPIWAGARWFRVLLILALAASVYGGGWWTGSRVNQGRHDKALVTALEAQQATLTTEYQKQLNALRERYRAENEALGRIRDIPRPNTGDCPVPEWVQPLTDAIRAANG